jgi:hypothetical protein
MRHLAGVGRLQRHVAGLLGYLERSQDALIAVRPAGRLGGALRQGNLVLLNCFQDGLPATPRRRSRLAQGNVDAHGVSASSRSKASNILPNTCKPPSTPSAAREPNDPGAAIGSPRRESVHAIIWTTRA